MKTRFMLPLFAASISSLPLAAGADEADTHPRIDSELTFTFRVTSEGEETNPAERRVSRFEISRVGVREVMALLETMLPGPEGEVAAPAEFPAGSRLLAASNGEVWVVDRAKNPILNVSAYITFSIDRPTGVESINSDKGRGQFQSTTLAPGNLFISIAGMIPAGEVSEALAGNHINVSGQLNDRYSSRTNLRTGRQTQTQSIRGNVTGDGADEGGFGSFSGNVRLNGRLTTEGL
ncbi:hypothetical protein [Haloferula sp.]|uniref:hypothetical protein n=1 Tax=Haloferula sp. TaxID=2497595 RepID=UPI00329B3943